MARPMRNPFFKCPNCDTLYQVVKAEAGPKTSDREIECLVCTLGIRRTRKIISERTVRY